LPDGIRKVCVQKNFGQIEAEEEHSIGTQPVGLIRHPFPVHFLMHLNQGRKVTDQPQVLPGMLVSVDAEDEEQIFLRKSRISLPSSWTVWMDDQRRSVLTGEANSLEEIPSEYRC